METKVKYYLLNSIDHVIDSTGTLYPIYKDTNEIDFNSGYDPDFNAVNFINSDTYKDLNDTDIETVKDILENKSQFKPENDIENSLISEMNPDQLLKYIALLIDMLAYNETDIENKIETEIENAFTELVNIVGYTDAIKSIIRYR